MNYADKYVKQPSEIPTTEHWAILTSESVTIPGDERSRTAPGHGYPEHTENYLSYAAYLKFEDFEAAMEKAMNDRWGKAVKGIHVAGVYSAKAKIQLSESR